MAEQIATAEDVFESTAEDLSVDDQAVDNNEDDGDDSAPRGYMSKEAWIAAGKDPDKYVSKEVYIERGERIKMRQQLEKDFDNRIKNLNLLHQAQIKTMREDLLAKRDEAIDTADKAAVKGYDKQLKELDDMEDLVKDQQQPSQVQKPPEVVEWEQENPWIFNADDPRVALANRIYTKAIEEGKTVAGALRAVDKEIDQKFIDKSKKPAQIAESSRPTGGSDKQRITMSSLTAEEKKIWDAGIFTSEKSFLKAVEDDRKAKKQ